MLHRLLMPHRLKKLHLQQNNVSVISVYCILLQIKMEENYNG